MRQEIRVIWETATGLGFQFSESDAHDVWLAVKAVQKKNKSKLIKQYETKSKMVIELAEETNDSLRKFELYNINTYLKDFIQNLRNI